MTTAPASIGANDTVNDVILRHPATLGVFRAHGIDACCGGALELGEVCRRHDLDLADLLYRLVHAAE